MRLFFISLGILFASVTQLFGQEKVQDSTKVEKLDEVIITAQYSPQTEKNAVYKVNIISSETIKQKAASNLREILQQELNINLEQNSVFGSSIEIQGVSKENVKILIDGTPIIGRLNGVIDLNQINLNTIEKIEIIEGPVSVFYGTDAMGGVINLITKKEQNETLSGNVSALYESIDATKVDATVGYKFDKNTIRINGGYYHFNGHSTNDSPRNLNWEERQQYFGDFMVSREFKDLTLRYNANLSNEKLLSIGEPDRFGRIQDIDYYTRRINNTLSLQGKVSETLFLDATGSYLDYRRYHDTFNVDPETSESTLSLTDPKETNTVKYRYAGIKSQLGKSNASSKLNYAGGFDFNSETSQGERILNLKQSIETVALFGSFNYKITEGFEIQPAARYTWNSSYGNLFSPAVNSKININENNTIRLSYARGFRAPSLKELFLDFHISAGPNTFIISGNEDLEVEESHSANLHYTFRKNWGTESSIKIEPSAFYNDITNLIALSEMVNFKRNYINIDTFKSLGGKLDVTYQPIKPLSIKAGFSYVGRYNKFNEDFESDEFLYAPEISSNINYNIEKAALNFSLYYKYSGERTGYFIDEDTNELNETTRDSFNNLDATISKSFLNNMFSASVGVKNILDVEDVETTNEIGEAHSRDMQLWGRSFFIRTSFNF
ncbi:MAG: TonB-dependent receptor [Flavobacteriaceae bacterium]|nr:TonB-dependent receptor [Flavobacteriaceae bacterium]